MIPKCKAYSPQHLGAGLGLQCDPDPDPIPWDRITLSDLIPYFLIPGIEKSIRSDKSADTVSDRICFTVDSSIPKDRSHSVMTLKPDELCA
ncbi:Kinesin-like protein kif20a [Puccinia graminis f. sp. tritici]|uniref:Kinesin-like protein kif20a n=1 Tax=Puccinia graminis f. sp. tritici TaxID=56615 RepID=A0A5B0NIB8_PUCGR|nr:Kinesin-like protein kif20a [Puccinia graminis f. sp. tritici]